MRELSPEGRAAIDELSQKHGFSPDAVQSMLWSVIAGSGTMAQFGHPEFAGSGQWMRGGMIMVSDMFNNALKGRIDGLCNDLAALVASQPDLMTPGSFQSQSQGASAGPADFGAQQQHRSGQHYSGHGSQQNSSLFVPPPQGSSGDWWGEDLGRPSSTGAQNNVRYAYFPETRRLAIEVNGRVTVYDTLDHHIGGFSQQQSHGASLSFASQHGLIEVGSLPVVSGETARAAQRPAPPVGRPGEPVGPEPVAPASPLREPSPPEAACPGGTDIFAAIERLAQLHGKGILTDEEFSAKKAELLSRL